MPHCMWFCLAIEFASVFQFNHYSSITQIQYLENIFMVFSAYQLCSQNYYSLKLNIYFFSFIRLKPPLSALPFSLSSSSPLSNPSSLSYFSGISLSPHAWRLAVWREVGFTVVVLGLQSRWSDFVSLLICWLVWFVIFCGFTVVVGGCWGCVFVVGCVVGGCWDCGFAPGCGLWLFVQFLIDLHWLLWTAMHGNIVGGKVGSRWCKIHWGWSVVLIAKKK